MKDEDYENFHPLNVRRTTKTPPKSRRVKVSKTSEVYLRPCQTFVLAFFLRMRNLVNAS